MAPTIEFYGSEENKTGIFSEFPIWKTNVGESHDIQEVDRVFVNHLWYWISAMIRTNSHEFNNDDLEKAQHWQANFKNELLRRDGLK